MKKLLLALFLLFPVLAQAQRGRNSISVSYGTGRGQIKPILGTVSETTKASSIHALGLNYNVGINKCGIFETGAMLLRHTYQFSYSNAGPLGSQITNSKKNLTALVLPLKLRFDMLKYFFISGGPFIDVDITKGIKPSLGVGIGVGAQYYYKNKYGIFIYPQTNLHTLDIGLTEQHITYGISYRIHKN
ncbi:MAG: hypothetical protein V4663_06760 [Bacteroidota bacterium]